MQRPAHNVSPVGWAAELVLRELHAAEGGLTVLNLAGRCFLPARQVTDALHELERAGLVSQRGRRWRALERRSGKPDARPAPRRRGQDGPGAHAA